MQTKEIKRRFKRWLALASLKFFCALLRILPRVFLYGFADFVAAVGYFVAVRHRRIARESLNIAFGKDKDDHEVKRIIKDCFAAMARGMLEIMVSINSPHILDKLVIVEGRENLDKALAGGKGVIMVSGHFGNFPLLLTKLSFSGYKVSVVVRKLRDENADEYFNKRRSALGVKSIYTQPRNACVTSSIAALRNNEIVFMLMDQNFGSGAGVFVDFFGKKAATATGPVVFALRTGAPILLSFIITNPDGKTHTLFIEPQLALDSVEDKDEMVRINVAKITAVIEKYIRRYPAEWGWMHRRWKSQPQNKN